jgi:hypothetical protein
VPLTSLVDFSFSDKCLSETPNTAPLLNSWGTIQLGLDSWIVPLVTVQICHDDPAQNLMHVSRGDLVAYALTPALCALIAMYEPHDNLQ